ncbi:hypothetical protein C7H19_07165 [Aphanothece hegewaldii CCALA 016]|uniref:Uncharacterized protein n=1 Tax=Aphanothece hegewaldii CCALA 016 TaxID=2107694 RepID=A0A2T1M0Q6_9CHRO|nr:hypothetical protein [Aphanothece hegewaldii]PSF38241.1 hypothetical protein C7H19_07165 [Aphanothece hegewaldii CCALA 016]
MLNDLLPFGITLDTTMIAGSCLWSLALYLGFYTLREWIIEKLEQWLNFADQTLYISQAEFEKSRKVRESQNAFYASVCSIIPFLAIGSLCNWGVELGLGSSWSVSIGLFACVACGVYELGRLDGQNK